jgi:transposase
LSTKIHTLVDALGNPVAFFLTGGQAHDLVGADHLLPDMEADLLIADKAFDADKRVIEPLTAAGKATVIPPKANLFTPFPQPFWLSVTLPRLTQRHRRA